MRSSIVFLSSFLWLATLAPDAAAQTAGKLNTQGFRLYKQKKYPEALAKFQAAVHANPKHALAHYNLACVLSILRSQGQTCEHDAYRGTIIQHLEKSVRLDPRRRKRMREDPDLEAVRDTFGYYRLLGLSVENPAELKIILEKVAWYGPSPGAFGPCCGMDFNENGRFTYWTLDVQELVRRMEIQGTWKLQGTKILLRFDKPVGGVRDHQAVLKPSGEFRIQGMDVSLTDDPSDCSA